MENRKWYLEELSPDELIKPLDNICGIEVNKTPIDKKKIKSWVKGLHSLSYPEFKCLISLNYLLNTSPLRCHGIIYLQDKMYRLYSQEAISDYIKIVGEKQLENKNLIVMNNNFYVEHFYASIYLEEHREWIYIEHPYGWRIYR